MTGASGFLGIHLAQMLINKGYFIYLLVRPYKTDAPEKRMHKLFQWMDMDFPNPSRVHIIPGDVNRSDLGLTREEYRRLASRVDEIIHCASDTSFSEQKRDQVKKANVENLHHLLGFAAKSNCFCFHHISTAYVAGKKCGPCPEGPAETTRYFNVYEETKHQAEKTAAHFCRQHGIQLNIYRPSVVYGHSRTGKTLRFNALYYPVKTLLFLKNLYYEDFMHKSGKNAGKMGITFDENGKAHLPIRIETVPESGINLIPVDYFTDAFSAVMATQKNGGIYHLVNDKNTSIAQLIDYSQRYFNISGIQAVCPENIHPGSKTHLELLFERCIKTYKPYMKDERIFENHSTRAVLN
ncbi:MAG: SDR family oxidoreductase, partial [Desulfotignum sp.]